MGQIWGLWLIIMTLSCFSDHSIGSLTLKTRQRSDCPEDQFKCGDSVCIPSTWVCDSETDCTEGEDERNCGERTCSPSEYVCPAHGSTPSNCIPASWKCDDRDRPDCVGGEDELDCDQLECPAGTFKCTGENFCPLLTWRCDGDHDCLSGEDEADCGAQGSQNFCTNTEFMCQSGECILKEWKCDGDTDCQDESDEIGCQRIECADSSEFYCTADDICIPSVLTCSGRPECSDGEDEMLSHCTSPQEELGHGNRSQCPVGYEYDKDVKECMDVDECRDQMMSGCDQLCLNEEGSYRCSCFPGYMISHDGKSCEISGNVKPKLLFTTRHSINMFTLASDINAQPVLVQNSGASTVDFDYMAEEVFYSDFDMKELAKFSLLSADQADVVNQINLDIPVERSGEGLAYDWIYKNLYWTDSTTDSINMVEFDDQGTPQRTMVMYNDSDQHCASMLNVDLCIDEPRAIVVHPQKGWVFWSDWGYKPHIAFGHLDGSHREMIAYNTDDTKNYLGWPNGLTLDTSGVNEKLYWIDAKLHGIFLCLVDRCMGDIRPLIHDVQKISHPYSITVFGDQLYWTDWTHNWIATVNKHSGENITSILNNLRQPMDVKVYHPNTQQHSTNHCKDCEGNPICDHFCFPMPWTRVSSAETFVPVPADGAQYICKCEENYTLQTDGTTCILNTSPPYIEETVYDVSYNGSSITNNSTSTNGTESLI